MEEIVDIRYPVKGFIVIKPVGMKAIKKLYNLFENELEKNNHEPVHFPAVIPEQNLRKEEEHFKGFESEVFWITKAGLNELNEKLILRPTSETAIYPMYSLWIKSYRDLPLKYYISGTVWRYETKSTRPLIRGREFLWIETHCAFKNKEDAYKQISEDLSIAKKIVRDKLKIDFIMVRRPRWDTFAGAQETFAIDTLLPDGKVLQIATTHYLGENFAKVFNIKYVDSDMKEKYVHQTCFGIGINRILASVIHIHSDNIGIVYPSALADGIVIPISEDAVEKAKEIAEKANLKLDLDFSKTPGERFYYWDRKGVPYKLVIGKKEIEQNFISVYRRDGKKYNIKDLKELENIIQDFDNSLFKPLKITNVSSFEELKKALDQKVIARACFCSVEKDGIDCYNKIKQELKAEVRGYRIDIQEQPEGNCIVCNRKANHVVYIAKQY